LDARSFSGWWLSETVTKMRMAGAKYNFFSDIHNLNGSVYEALDVSFVIHKHGKTKHIKGIRK
jgi:hypothetical protein